MAVERTRGGGRYTESAFFGFIRSGLRNKYVRWPPRYEVLREARRPSKDKKNARLKWQFQCAKCRRWKAQKDVEVDHIIPAGSLRCFEDLPGFCERLFCEKEGLRVLCRTCHKKITDEQRNSK
jgi:hypothetical protein